MNATLDLQRALRARLAGDAAVAAILGQRVFDSVAETTMLPYATFGDIETRDWSTQTHRGHEHIVTIHVWSGAAGRRQALEAIDAMDHALEAGIDCEHHRVVTLRTVFWTVVHDLENELYHGLMRLRVVTELATEHA